MEMVVLSGEPISGLKRYLRGHPEVAFVACKEAGYLGRSYLNGSQANNALPVPVVVVAASTESSVAQDRVDSDSHSHGANVA
jgi:hypothetical protein